MNKLIRLVLWVYSKLRRLGKIQIRFFCRLFYISLQLFSINKFAARVNLQNIYCSAFTVSIFMPGFQSSIIDSFNLPQPLQVGLNYIGTSSPNLLLISQFYKDKRYNSHLPSSTARMIIHLQDQTTLKPTILSTLILTPHHNYMLRYILSNLTSCLSPYSQMPDDSDSIDSLD